MVEIVEVTPSYKVKEALGKAGEVVVAGAKKAGEVLVEYGPKAIEWMATEKFPRLVRNVVFLVMVGIMAYTMIRIFGVITPTAEYAAGQFATVIGTMIVIAIPIMIFFLVFAIIKAILKWVAG